MNFDASNQGTSNSEFPTEAFLVLCFRCGLSKQDLEDLTIGVCLDIAQEYIESHKPQDQKVRKATQGDFDSF